jgi:hypothetical protein
MCAAIDPTDGGDASSRERVWFWEREVVELDNLWGVGGPEIDAVAESDREHIALGPVDKVEVEVVLEGWCV